MRNRMFIIALVLAALTGYCLPDFIRCERADYVYHPAFTGYTQVGNVPIVWDEPAYTKYECVAWKFVWNPWKH